MGAIHTARRLAANGVRAFRRVASGPVLPAPTGNWLVVDLHGPVPEFTRPSYGRRGAGALGLLDLLRSLEVAAGDPGIEGVLIRFRGALGSFSQALSLHRALLALRAAGKRAAVWAEGLSAEQHLVACAADRIWLPEAGSLNLIGLRSERIYLREILDSVGVKPEVVHIGKFKSAGDMLTRESMSQEEREQIESWQSDLFEELVSGIAAGRSLTPEEVRALIDRGPYSASAAHAAGLIDGCCYLDDVERELESLTSVPGPGLAGPRRVQLVEMTHYFQAVVSDPGWLPLRRELPALVYLLASGGVQRGSGQRGVTSGGLGDLLEGLRTDDAVRGVALRIESPGGDALASDLLYRSVERLRREKPVVVSMGDVVASGGYYIAAAADAVYAEVGTITGSIGVVGMKVNLEGLYRRLGIVRESVEQGARAGLYSETRGYTPDERAAVRGEMETIYETFLERVIRGRKLSRSALERAAQGRIWSGRRAHQLGLVDALGGPLEALKDLGARAGLREGEAFTLPMLPRPSRLPNVLRALLSDDRLAARGSRWLDDGWRGGHW